MEKYDIQNFSDVWSRVISESGAAQSETRALPKASVSIETSELPDILPPDMSLHGVKSDVTLLCRFIKGEAADAKYYNAMAIRCRQNRTVFHRLSADEANHEKQLRAAYFILTGDCCGLNKDNFRITSLSDALRMRYIKETEGSFAYIEAARSAESENLRRLYTRIAADEKHHADVIEELIEHMVC